MLDNLSKYVYEIYRCRSVSAAAKNLYISQPALSTSLKKAEDALGAPIFNRKSIPFTLTAEGKVYIDAIEKILKIEQEAKNSIQDISDLKSGTLRIGTASHLSYFVIPKICSAFSRRFPSIDISVVTTSSDLLPSLLEKGTADIIITSDNLTEQFHSEALFDEKIIVALRKDLCPSEMLSSYALCYDDIISRKYPAEKEISDISVFKDTEFIYTPPHTTTFKKHKSIFGQFKTDTHITATSGIFLLSYNLMCSGFGALFTTDASLATMPPNNECVYFSLNDVIAKQSFCLAYKENSNLISQKIINEFINTARELFSCENPLPFLTLL